MNKAADNAVVLAELGMYPVSIQALKLSIGFWLHVLNSGENSLVTQENKSSVLDQSSDKDDSVPSDTNCTKQPRTHI